MIAIVVMARAPELGKVKTRLARTLGDAATLALYRAMLKDRLAQLSAVKDAWHGVAFTPRDAGEAMRNEVGPNVNLIAQRGEDLGERLLNAARDALAAGNAGVLLVDADTPILPVEFLRRAVASLDTHDVVLGPASDGGYYLIGLREAEPALFEGIPWSTAEVAERTRAAARGARKTIVELPTCVDVDGEAELREVARALRAPGMRDMEGFPSHTAEALASIA